MEYKRDEEIKASVYEGLGHVIGKILDYLSDAEVSIKELSIDAIMDFIVRIKAEQLKYKGYDIEYRKNPLDELKRRLKEYDKDHNPRHLIDMMFYAYMEIVARNRNPKMNGENNG